MNKNQISIIFDALQHALLSYHTQAIRAEQLRMAANGACQELNQEAENRWKLYHDLLDATMQFKKEFGL